MSLSSEDKEDDKEEEDNNNKVNEEEEEEEESEKADDSDWSNLSVSIEASVVEESVLQEPDMDGTDGSEQLEQQAEGGQEEEEVGLPML